MTDRNLPPQTGADSARDIFGEYGLDGGFSDIAATERVDPKPLKIWQYLDKLRSTGITERGDPDPQPVAPNEIALLPEITFTTALTITAGAHEGRTLRFTGTSPLTQPLPALAGVEDGLRLRFHNTGSATLTLDPSGSEQISDALTLDIPPGVSATIEKTPAAGWRHTGREAIARVPGAVSRSGFAVTNAAGDIVDVLSVGVPITPLLANTTFFVRSTGQNCTMSAGTPGVVNCTGHGLAEGMRVFFNLNGGTIPAALAEGDGPFFVRNPTANTFNVSTTVGGGLLPFATSSAGSPQITSGDDANTGLNATPTGAFATLQGAIEALRTRYSLNGRFVTISLHPGTYLSAGQNVPAGFIGSSGLITVQPRWTGSFDVTLNRFTLSNGSGVPILFQDLRLSGITASGPNTIVSVLSGVSLSTTVDFLATDGGYINISTNVSGTSFSRLSFTAGSRTALLQATRRGTIFVDGTETITFTGSFTYSAAAASASDQGLIRVTSPGPWTGGTHTGQRHNAAGLSLINTGTANASFFPGSTAGAVSLGGVFN